jgi:diadenosine tetraphosphate (Ap4A) HIT family hydrolase
LNYELLGNGAPHLHWHLFPRYDTDPSPGWPVWSDPEFRRQLDEGVGSLEPHPRVALRRAILRELEAGDVAVERAYC